MPRFKQLLRLEYPSAGPTELSSMLSFVQRLKTREDEAVAAAEVSMAASSHAWAHACTHAYSTLTTPSLQ